MEKPPAVDVRCTGCGRHFDDQEDVCPIPHGVAGDLCRRCHVTVLGVQQPHTFRQKELLS